MSRAAIGASPRRLEDERFLRGRGRFTDDIAPRDALQVVFLRSPHAHAHIRKLDADAARRLPGVVAVLTGAEVAADGLGALPVAAEIRDAAGNRHIEPPRPAIPADRVRHVGEIVAMVVAQTLDQARDAAERIVVDYQPLPAVVAGDAALLPGAPQIHDEAPGNLSCDWSRGDPEAVAAAFAGAARVVRLGQRFNRIVASYLEPRALAARHEDGLTTLIMSGQGSHIPHALLCDAVLRWPRDSLRVITPDVGGGFGPKLALYPELALLPWAARRLGRPLHWTCERTEAFLADNHARDLAVEMALALDGDGRFLALRAEGVANFGAWVSLFAPPVPTASMAKVISGLYRIPALAVRVRCAFTNTVPVDAFRGAGKPETLALLERLIDVAAQECGLDPVQIRRRNLISPAAFPYTSPLGYTYEGGDYGRLLELALEAADRPGFEARQRASEARGLRRGFGIACHLHPTGGVADEQAQVIVQGDGTVEALTGTQSQGQGHETAFAQVVAAALGIELEQVQVVQGDTARIPRGGGTGGSSSAIISANTLERAAGRLIDNARDAAADLLEAAPSDLVFGEGVFAVAGTDRRIGLFEIAASLEAAGGRLEGEAAFADAIESWPTGIMTCEVELDPDTGTVRVDRLSSVADLGTVINPMLVAGQIHGGIAAGLGQALLEDARYDGESGQLLAASWMDYALPRADDVPAMAVRTVSLPSPGNRMGIKGVGELPTNGAPAVVANAVLDALRPFGVRHLPSPMTPERIWRAIREAPPPAGGRGRE
jgi:aerobic carbon-monoxide dehydrogenase large subunit